MLYLSYGSNLNLEQMKIRCPKATPIRKLLVPNFRLVFRGVADIEQMDGYKCPMGLWKITDDCEKKLDAYEGFPNLYSKMYFKINGELAMTYVMNTNRISPPNSHYFDVIKKGYEDFNLDKSYLYKARQKSISESYYTNL